MSSALQREITVDILRLGRDEAWTTDMAVVEKTLASRLGVSRTPVRRALTALADDGILRREPGHGFVLNRRIDDDTVSHYANAHDHSGDIYQRILSGRSSGIIPNEITESALISRFQVARGDLRKALLRLSGEGIIHRQRGHGWRFAESLDTPRAIVESYAFREAIETAALRQPGYVIDAPALLRLTQAHLAFMAQPPTEISADAWFSLNAAFHEVLASWSMNRFFHQAIKRQNSLRKMHQLVDFAQLTADQIKQSCKEHIAILEALRSGDRDGAASLLSSHLLKAASDWEHET